MWSSCIWLSYSGRNVKLLSISQVEQLITSTAREAHFELSQNWGMYLPDTTDSTSTLKSRCRTNKAKLQAQIPSSSQSAKTFAFSTSKLPWSRSILTQAVKKGL